MRLLASLATALWLMATSFAQSPSTFRTYPTIAPAEVNMTKVVNSGTNTYAIGTLDNQTVVVHQFDNFGNVVAERQFPVTITAPDAILDIDCNIAVNSFGKVVVAFVPKCASSIIQPRVILMAPGLTSEFDVFVATGATQVRSLELDGLGSVLMGTVGASTVTVRRLSSLGDSIFSTTFPGTDVRIFQLGVDGMVILQNGNDVETRRVVLSNGTFFNGTTIANRVLKDAGPMTATRYVMLMQSGANAELQSDTVTNNSPVVLPLTGVPTSMAVSAEVYVTTAVNVYRVVTNLTTVTNVPNTNQLTKVYADSGTNSGFGFSGVFGTRTGRTITLNPLAIGTTAFNVDTINDMSMRPRPSFLVGSKVSPTAAFASMARYRVQDGSNVQETFVPINGPVKFYPTAAITTPEGDVVMAIDQTKVARISRTGTTLWTTEIFSPRSPSGPSVRNIHRLSNGRIIVHTSANTNLDDLGASTHQFLCLDASTGTVIYTRSLTSSGSVIKQLLTDLVGDFYVLSTEVGRFGSMDMVLRRLSGATGSTIWERFYDGSSFGSPDDALQMFRLASGNIMSFAREGGSWFYVQTQSNGITVNSGLTAASTIRAIGLAPSGNFTILSLDTSVGRKYSLTSGGAIVSVPCPAAIDAKAVFLTSNSKAIAVSDTRVAQLNDDGSIAWAFLTSSPQLFVKQIFFDSVGAIYVARSRALDGTASSGMQVDRLNSLGTSIRTVTFDVIAPLFQPVGVKFLQGKELDLWLTGNVYETNKGRVVCLAKFGTPLAPVVRTDNYTTPKNTQLLQAAPGVLLNDTDPNGNTMTVTLVTNPPPQQGAVTLNPNGSFTFTPANNFTGATKFTYRATDSSGLNSVPATVNITVTN